MARRVKEEDYSARRNEILDSARRFIYTKGFDQMTIQDILDDLQISKGAFYHYFDSKQDLLEALIERLLDEVEQVLEPVIQDDHLSAIDKLNTYFATAGTWKTARKEYLLALVRTWYDDDNAVVRQKYYKEWVKRVTPMLAGVIRQGIREGSMQTPYPDMVGEILLSLFQGVGETFARAILAPEEELVSLEQIEASVSGFTHALERILGAPTGSIILIDRAVLKEWFPDVVLVSEPVNSLPETR